MKTSEKDGGGRMSWKSTERILYCKLTFREDVSLDRRGRDRIEFSKSSEEASN